MASPEPRKRKVSNPLGLAVLSLLFERPMHPYEMASTLRQRAKEESIKLNYGSLYTTVKALQRAGFVVAREKVRKSARPERTVYGLTALGDLELHDWMRELLSTPMKEYTQFEAALSLMPVLPPGEVVTLLRERQQRLEEGTERLRADMQAASKQGVERLFLIETEYLLAMREAERDWIAALLRLIDRTPGFTRPWSAWHEKRRAQRTPREAAAGKSRARSKRH